MKARLLCVMLGFFFVSRLLAVEPGPVVSHPVLVSVHGAWAGGWQFKKVATLLEARGYLVYRPSLSGLGEHFNTSSPDIGLATHIDDIVNFILFENLHDVILLGHSYGGMIITAVADRLAARVRRLVYWNAFVPHDGQAVIDLVPNHYAAMFKNLIADDGSVTLPFPIWREAFINDAPLALAEHAYRQLNPHPYASLAEPVRLSRTPAALPMAKSFLNCSEDTALPHSLGWHPRLSEKLGLFRLVQCAGSHELCFTNPTLLGQKIMEAGRD